MILTARTARHFDLAAPLLREQREWIASLVQGEAPPALQGYRHPSEIYGRPGALLLLGFAGRRPAGIVALHALGEPGLGELKRMWVTPADRGTGLGRALVAAACHTAARVGYDRLRLETSAQWMPAAHALYVEHGFVEAAEQTMPHVAEALTMERELPAMSFGAAAGL